MGYLKEGSPARYHLATTGEVIQIAVNKKIVLRASNFSPRLTEEISKTNNLPDLFIPPSSDREWGFGPILREEQSENPEYRRAHERRRRSRNERRDPRRRALYRAGNSDRLTRKSERAP